MTSDGTTNGGRQAGEGGARGRPLPQVRGRGAARNPANRFRELDVVPDRPEGADEAGPETRYYRDSSRSIIATNDSPDVGFEASVNPYRGCEHGCVYCLHPDTPVLRADTRTVPLGALRPGDRVYATRKEGHYRTLVTTTVLDTWTTEREAYRITLGDGTELIASADHRFLTDRGWRFVTASQQGARRRRHLTTRNRLLGPGGGLRSGSPHPGEQGRGYRRGYLAGTIRGDGLPGHRSHERPGPSVGDHHRFRLALTDREPLERVQRYLREMEIAIESVVRWPGRPDSEWQRGFLAGIFDAEGRYSDGVLRIANMDPEIGARVAAAVGGFGFDPVVERGADGDLTYVRLRGGLRPHLEFFLFTDPAISRKRDISGTALKSSHDRRVRSVEPLGRRITMVDITTGTGDFIADGVVSHNCYARPGHEYLGLSSGLDFETRIFVKENAPGLLRRELSDPGWEPKTLALSGVTDPYQPVEREMEITRGCLEVLAEFRNPVSMITKNHLITRDVDLLAELAGHGAASASLSITTLDPEIRRLMEPRTSSPRRRLKAVEALADAGVPVGVMVAPVIPGLTDHEMPRILQAAAEAGASRASYIVLRLPHAVEELFVEWLERHFPDRKEKVLGRLRDLRGGKLYDATFGERMRGRGPFAEQMGEMFDVTCRRLGLNEDRRPLSVGAFRRPHTGDQMELFA